MSDAPLRVVRAHADRGVAAHADGRLREFRFSRRTPRPLPGDRIRLDAAARCVQVEPRTSVFGRGDRRGRFRALAANPDRALIIIAPEPAPSRDLLHRYLAACHLHDIEPLIVVNKHDLALPERPPFNELAQLARLGYEIIPTRSLPPVDSGGLEARIGDGVSLLAGQSGVGKSSLINALFPGLELATGELSRSTGKGTHTTTSASASRIGTDAWLIDTPGVWEYGLWAMPAAELQRGFPEFAAHAGRCKFRDCRHQSEPGCAVHAATNSGDLPAFRYRAWLRLLAEQNRLQSDSDCLTPRR